MKYIGIFPTIFVWWYSEALKNLLGLLNALFINGTKTFSIGSVLMTFFSPWKKLVSEKQPGMLGFRDWLLDNFVSRTIGVIMRLVIVIMFVTYMFLYFLFSFLSIIFWAFLPLLILFSFFYLFAGY